MDIRLPKLMQQGAVLLAFLLWISLAYSEELTASQVLYLATNHWYEGLPTVEPQSLSPAGLSVLTKILSDDSRSKFHAQALEILGRSGGAGALEKIVNVFERFNAIDLNRLSRTQNHTLAAALLALAQLASTNEVALTELINKSTLLSNKYFQDSNSSANSMVLESCIIALSNSNRKIADEKVSAIYEKLNKKETRNISNQSSILRKYHFHKSYSKTNRGKAAQ